MLFRTALPCSGGLSPGEHLDAVGVHYIMGVNAKFMGKGGNVEDFLKNCFVYPSFPNTYIFILQIHTSPRVFIMEL